MRLAFVHLCIFTLSLTIAGSVVAWAAAQADNVGDILKRYEQLHRAGDYRAALVEAQKLEATVRARSGKDGMPYAGALRRVGAWRW